jgi:hypothetical protein
MEVIMWNFIPLSKKTNIKIKEGKNNESDDVNLAILVGLAGI